MSSNYLKSGEITRKQSRRRGKTLLPARVVDVILDSSHPEFEDLGRWDSIGVIKYRLLGKKQEEDSPQTLSYAYPLRAQLKYIPLKNEIVFLVPGPSQNIDNYRNSAITYYIDTVSIWNHPHWNPYPENTNGDPEPDRGFISRSDVNPMQPFPGDLVLEGRHGQSLRFSSTVPGATPWNGNTSGDPITVLSNGQIETSNGFEHVVEDVNKDASSIYLTSTQNINLSNAQTFTAVSSSGAFGDTSQVVINAGKLVLNGKYGSITGTAASYVAFKGSETYLEGSRVVVTEAPLIKLGVKASEPVMLADTTLNFLTPVLNDLILLCNALLLTPYPQVQLYAQNLSLKIATFKENTAFMKSKKVKAE